MIYSFDLDGTLCTDEIGNYPRCLPIDERVEIVNALYDEGHTIMIVTGRHDRWKELTANQLKEWNVKYHILETGKPYANIYIDDKGISSDDFFNKL